MYTERMHPIPTHGGTQVTSRRHAVHVAADGELRIWDRQVGAGETCRRILKALPTWFGIPASLDDYVAAADRSPTVIASLGDEDVGFLTVVRHSEYAAEVYVMAVVPQLHRQGIGRALLGHAERVLAADGVGFLQVKTLAASKPNDGYDTTRAFYLAYGFRPLEEFRNLWDGESGSSDDQGDFHGEVIDAARADLWASSLGQVDTRSSARTHNPRRQVG